MDDPFKPVLTIPLTELRSRFGHYMDLAIDKGPVLATRYGKPAVVLISLETYRQLRRLAEGEGRDL